MKRQLITRKEPSHASKVIQGRAIVLVVNDVEETRDGLERLLTSDGYRVYQARGVDDAVRNAKSHPPALILLSLSGGQSDWIAAAARIRKRAELTRHVPILLFCIDTIPEGAKVQIRRDTYFVRPDNFDQLREFINCLLTASRPL